MKRNTKYCPYGTALYLDCLECDDKRCKVDENNNRLYDEQGRRIKNKNKEKRNVRSN